MLKITTSVIICTRNRLDDIILCLNSVAQQTKVPEELLVIDSSTQPINQYEKFQAVFNNQLFPQSQLIYKHTKPGLTYQRNVGIALSSKEIIYFFDDDTILEATYLQEMNLIFDSNPQYAGGMGSITNIDPKKNNLHRLLRIMFLLQRDYASGKFTTSGIPTHPYGTTTFKRIEVLGGCCMAFRSSILECYKFDEHLTRYAYMEDCDIARRISFERPLFYNPKARLKHLASPLSRDAIIDNRAMFIKNYSYLFFKNFYPRNKFKILAYSWSILGLFIEAILLRNKDCLKGYCKGLRDYYKNS